MLITIGLTILGIAAVLSILFYFMYHTYHGDLPGIMQLIITVFLLVAAGFIIFGFLL